MVSKNEQGEVAASTPQIGDVTICCECGEFCEFGPRDTLLKIADEEKLASLSENPDAMMATMMAAMVRGAKKNKDGGKEYQEQIKKMAVTVRVWTKKNPTKSPMIQRNSTSKMFLVGTLADAIEHKFVSVNDDAMLMLTELGWLDKEERMPTVFMAESAIEWAFKDSVD